MNSAKAKGDFEEIVDKCLKKGFRSFHYYDFYNGEISLVAEDTFEAQLLASLKKRGYSLEGIRERYPPTYFFKKEGE